MLPSPSTHFSAAYTREGIATLDGKILRTIEYDMPAFMASCVKLYSECIEAVQPGSAVLVRPADLPNDTRDVGGNATSKGSKHYGDRWEHYPEGKAWTRVHDRPRTALFTPIGVKGGPKREDLPPTRVTRMNFAGWGDDGEIQGAHTRR